MYNRTPDMASRFGLAAHAMMAPADDSGSQEEFSLADLADLDVSDIDEIRFETIPMGVYTFEVTEAGLEEDTDKEGAKRFRAEVTVKIVEVNVCLDNKVDKESLVGKTMTEKMFIHPGKEPAEVQKQIGRIRAWVSDAGMESTGKLGDIIGNLKGHMFKAKVAHQTDKDDKSIKYARIKHDAKK